MQTPQDGSTFPKTQRCRHRRTSTESRRRASPRSPMAPPTSAPPCSGAGTVFCENDAGVVGNAPIPEELRCWAVSVPPSSTRRGIRPMLSTLTKSRASNAVTETPTAGSARWTPSKTRSTPRSTCRSIGGSCQGLVRHAISHAVPQIHAPRTPGSFHGCRRKFSWVHSHGCVAPFGLPLQGQPFPDTKRR